MSKRSINKIIISNCSPSGWSQSPWRRDLRMEYWYLLCTNLVGDAPWSLCPNLMVQHVLNGSVAPQCTVGAEKFI